MSFYELKVENPELLGLRIDALDLSTRTSNCLRNANITTVGELMGFVNRNPSGWNGLMRLPQFGRKSMHELRGVVAYMVDPPADQPPLSDPVLGWAYTHRREIQAILDGRAAIMPSYLAFHAQED